MKKTVSLLLALMLVLSTGIWSMAQMGGDGAIGTVTITATGRVNVRTGGSTDFPALTMVSPGEVFPCLSVAATGWYEIQLPDGRLGFVSNNMARLDAAATHAVVPVYYRTVDGRLLYTDYYRAAYGMNEIYANNAFVPGGYTLQSANRVLVNVSANGSATPSGVLFIYASQGGTVTQAPQQTVARVTISYKDIYGSVLKTTTMDLRPGSHLVTANAALLPAGYTLVGARDAVVSVSAGLVANPASVTFLCVRSATPTQAPASSAVVPVHYMTTGGTWLYTEYLTLQTGYTTVSANDGRVPADYTLFSGRSTSVYVNGQGVASPSAITFLYQQRPSQPLTVSVPVFYRSSDGRTLNTDYVTCYQGTNTIYANDAKVPGYSLQSSRSVAVYVSSAGVASPASVVFTYAVPVTASVSVRYLDNAGNQLNSEWISVAQGSHTIYANASRVPPGYVLQSAGHVTVFVDASGAVNPSIINFTYAPPGPSVPTATPVPPSPPSGGNYTLPMYQKASISGEYAVYTGPGDWFYRTGGNANVKMGVCRWYGTEGNWVLMGYQYDTGKYRLGYIDKAGIPAGVSVPEMKLMYEPVTVISQAAITDDPVIKPVWLFRIPAGTTVKLLGFLPDNDHWAYIETDYTGQQMRGFINRVRIGR